MVNFLLKVVLRADDLSGLVVERCLHDRVRVLGHCARGTYGYRLVDWTRNAFVANTGLLCRTKEAP